MVCIYNYNELLCELVEDGVLTSFSNSLDLNFDNVQALIKEVKQSLDASSRLKLGHITNIEENFVKYQNEKNRQYLKEEQDCKLETEKLMRAVDDLKRESDIFDVKIKDETAELYKLRAQAKETKKKVEAFRREDEKVREQLERIKKSYSIAIGWYQVYLGIQISLGRNRVIITFGTFEETFQASKHKVTLLIKDEGYMAEDGNTILTPQEIMKILTQARESFTNPPQSITQRDSEGSTTASL